MVKKIIVGNWKMNPTSYKNAKDLLATLSKAGKEFKKTTVVICPPAPYLALLKKDFARSSVLLGAQDAHEEVSGAYTGSYSAPMLKDAGATYVIIGHSERRKAGDTDKSINAKIKLALKAGLQVILCVGETARDEHGDYLTVIAHQLKTALEGVSKNQLTKISIAYEPVWAIGTEATGVDTPENFHHNAIYIRKIIADLKGVSAARLPILYGGSVTTKNAESFLSQGHADGLLVGRESLNAKNFITIAAIASRY